MSNIKYIIEVGNCQPGINEDIKGPTVIGRDSISWDSMEYSFDSTIITFDNI